MLFLLFYYLELQRNSFLLAFIQEFIKITPLICDVHEQYCRMGFQTVEKIFLSLLQLQVIHLKFVCLQVISS